MARSTRRRRLLVALGVMGGVAGVVLAGVGLGVLWLSTPNGNRWIATKALGAADAALPGDLTVGSLDSNVIRFIELRDVTLTDLEGDPVVTIERLRLDYRLRGIFARQVVVRSIEVEGPRFDLHVRPDGQLDLLAALGVEPTPPDAPDEPPSAWSGIGGFTVAVERVALSGGAVRYRDATDSEAPVDIALRDIDLGGAATVSGATVEVSRLTLLLAADSPIETPASLELQGAYEAGDVRIDRLVAGLKTTRLSANGRIQAVETQPNLDLSIDVPRLDADEVNRLVGDAVVSASPGLVLRATGPLDALELVARLTDDELGALSLVGGANLTATPLTWNAAFETPRFDLQPLLPAITEPVVVDGRWAVEGAGVGWPDDLVARFEVDAAAPTLWGEPLRDLVLRGRLEGGVVQVEQLQARHAVGTLRADGTIAVTDSAAVVQVSARVPTLAALRRFDVSGFVGSADFDGTVRANWAAEAVRVEARGQLRGRGLGMPESEVSLASLVVPLTATLDGERVDASGTLVAQGLQAPGASVAELRLPSWHAEWSPSAGAVGEAEVAAKGVDVGDGAVGLDSIFGTAGGGADAQNVPFARADVVMSDLVFGGSGVKAEGGPVEMALNGSALTARFDLDRSADAFFEGQVTGDLAGGDWTVDGLVLAPTAGKPWRAPQPVTFVLADGGVRALELALHSESGSIAASGDWVGASSDGTNLTLGVEGLVLADVAQIVQTYVPAAPGAPPLLDGLAGALDLDVELSDWAGAQGAGIDLDLTVRSLTYPGAVEGVDVDVGVGGSFGRPRAELVVSTDKGGELVVGEVGVPLRLRGGLPAGLDCDGSTDLLMILTPGPISRIGTALPDLELPTGDLSASVAGSASPCDPDLHITGAARLVAGTRGQRVRVDVDVERVGPEVTVAAAVFEGQRRRLALDGTATTRLTERLAALLQPSEPAPSDALSTAGASDSADSALPSAWIERFDVSVVPVGLPLSTLGLFTDLPTGVRGVLAGGLNLSGTPNDPSLSGALLLVDGHLGSVPLSQAQVLVYPGLPPDGGAMGYQVEGHFGFGADASAGSLDLTGHLPLALNLDLGADQVFDHPGFSLGLSGDGLPLEVLPGVVAGVPQAHGLLKLDGAVLGTMLDPEFSMRARIDGGSVTATDLGIQYNDIGLDLSVDADRLRLNKLRADAVPLYGGLLQGANSTSRVSVAGSLLMDRFTPTQVQAHLSATELWLISTDDYQLRANARIDLAGTWPNLRVSGDTELVQGRVSLPDSIFREGSSLELDPVLTIHRKRAIGEGRKRKPNPLLENLDLELNVDLHRGLQLMASIPTLSDYGQQFAELSSVEVDVELSSPSLALRSRGTDVQVNGTLEMNRGGLDIMGRSFDVGGGSVSFVSDVTDPILDISATHRTGQYGNITVDVGGSVSDLQLDFSSEEYPDKTDVMAILLLGKPTSEMSSTDGDMGGSLLSAAVGSVASNLSKTVSSAFLGQIEIDSDSFKMGFPVGRDIFGTVELRSTEDDDENSLEVTLEWLLSRRLSAELVTGDAAQTSADIYYRWRF